MSKTAQAQNTVCASLIKEGVRCGLSETDHDRPIFLGSDVWNCSHGKECLKLGHVFAPPCELENCGKSEIEHYCKCICHPGNDPGYHCEHCDGGPLGHDFNGTDDDAF